MPGTVQELSRKLLNAIDSEGNVTDMGIVLEVVEALEGILITADDIRTNCLGKNINQLRRKLADSDKSLAKRLKKLVKTWQQLIQRQTPNGLTAPSLSGAVSGVTSVGGVSGVSKSEQPSTDLHHSKPNVVDAKRRRSVSFSREGTPSQPIGESLASKSSRTPTPTPSPHPPSSTPSSSSSPASVPPAPTGVPTPQPSSVIPRPTKAQDFARNRIRRMQMFSAVKKPNVGQVPSQSQQPPLSSSSSATDDPSSNQPHPPDPGTVTGFQSLSHEQTTSMLTTPLPPESNSLNKSSTLLSQSESQSAGPISNGSHLPVVSSQPSSFSSSPAYVKSTNTPYRSGASLSQIVTNSFNHKPSSNPTISAPPPLGQSSIAHKIGMKGFRGKNSHRRPETPPTHPETPPTPPKSLVVRIPRNQVHIRSLLNDRTPELSHKDNVSSSSWLPQERSVHLPHEEQGLVVSIDVSQLPRGRASTNSHMAQSNLESRPHRTEGLTQNHHDLSSLSRPLSTQIQGPTGSQSSRHHDVADDDEPMETDSNPLFGKREIPFGEPHSIPSGAYPGVHGCLGSDGCWYAWTDMIPGCEESVTVLPYIYIDNESENGIDL